MRHDMEYAAGSHYAFGRYYPWWQGLLAGWLEVRAGLTLLPQSLYMFLAALLPLFTSNVLLLDSAPAIPNVVVGGAVTVAVAVVGWLVKRVIENSDAGNARLEAGNARMETAVATLTKLVSEIGTEQKASAKLTEYLEKRVVTLEHKKEVLEKSFQEMDKLIAVKLNEKKH